MPSLLLLGLPFDIKGQEISRKRTKRRQEFAGGFPDVVSVLCHHTGGNIMDRIHDQTFCGGGIGHHHFAEIGKAPGIFYILAEHGVAGAVRLILEGFSCKSIIK